MNVLLFGGSFDPPHLGHVNLLMSMLRCERLGIEKTVIMPAFVSPFKQGRTGCASPEERLEMCRLAFGDIPGAEISMHEINAGTVSYTVDTLEYLRGIYPHDTLYMAVGGDSLKTLPHWRRARDILTMCIPAAAARCSSEKEDILRIAEELSAFGKVEAVDTEPFEVSSTEIREKLSRGEDISGLVPAAVYELIKKHGLYSC